MSMVLIIQGWFYILTGLWPIVHMPSFEKVSGPKTDKWLVRTVSLMILSSGLIFVLFHESRAALFLAIMNAFFLMSIDLYYVWKRIIWKSYLVDAVIEAGFIVIYLVIETGKTGL